MKKVFCSREKDILMGLKQDKLNPEQRQHLEECRICRDSVAVNSWMKDFSESSSAQVNFKRKVPDFEVIWKGFQTFKKYDQELEKKVLFPLIFPKILTAVVVFVGIIVLFTTSTAKIKDFVVEELKMGYLFDLLGLMGKSMFALVPFLVIPIVMVVSFMAFYFIFALFKPKKIPEQ